MKRKEFVEAEVLQVSPNMRIFKDIQLRARFCSHDLRVQIVALQHTECPMRKISLDVNALQVESFETADDKAKERGTVEAYYSLYTCPQTQCGQECLSGWRPCQPTDAFTDGQNACFCGGSGEYVC